MNRRLAIAVVIAMLAAALAAWWWLQPGQSAKDGTLLMHGNVDIREVELAFDGSERIAGVRQAMADAGLQFDKKDLLLINDPNQSAAGYQFPCAFSVCCSRSAAI